MTSNYDLGKKVYAESYMPAYMHRPVEWATAAYLCLFHLEAFFHEFCKNWNDGTSVNVTNKAHRW